MKPILFNTEMVRAILEGRKTVTRRVVKMRGYTPVEIGREYYCGVINGLNSEEGLFAGFFEDSDIFTVDGVTHIDAEYARAPYRHGDILYVRETWYKDAGRYMYRANYRSGEKFYRNGKEVTIHWCPSIHMPKEAARIFLRVTDVRVERLIEMSAVDAMDEGFTPANDDPWTARDQFADFWDSTIKPTDRGLYGWEANPFCWIISFERISKNEAMQ